MDQRKNSWQGTKTNNNDQGLYQANVRYENEVIKQTENKENIAITPIVFNEFTNTQNKHKNVLKHFINWMIVRFVFFIIVSVGISYLMWIVYKTPNMMQNTGLLSSFAYSWLIIGLVVLFLFCFIQGRIRAKSILGSKKTYLVLSAVYVLFYLLILVSWIFISIGNNILANYFTNKVILAWLIKIAFYLLPCLLLYLFFETITLDLYYVFKKYAMLKVLNQSEDKNDFKPNILESKNNEKRTKEWI